MRKFLMNLTIRDGGKKITAIRDMRNATFMGLVAAKTFIEQGGGDLIVNGDQCSLITILSLQPIDYTDDWATQINPSFTINSIKLIEEKGLDISDLLQA